MENEIFPLTLRRLKANRLLRELVYPLRLTHKSFILPLFIEENLKQPRTINGLNGLEVDNLSSIFKTIDSAMVNGIDKFLLFPVPEHKAERQFDFSFAADVVHKLKLHYGSQIWLATDICLCSYTQSGHCGIINSTGDAILNHESVVELTRYAVHLAQAGADCVAPSDMMDSRIKSIRQALNTHQLENVIILSYSTKFSSQWYGPFRDACHSSPNSAMLKDRRSYQLSPLSKEQALASALRDESEGADILMVKPAASNTDIIHSIKQQTKKPLAVYHVSGEFAAIELMAEKNLLDRAKAHLELWSAFQRSGADIIISYAAPHAKSWIENFES